MTKVIKERLAVEAVQAHKAIREQLVQVHKAIKVKQEAQAHKVIKDTKALMSLARKAIKARQVINTLLYLQVLMVNTLVCFVQKCLQRILRILYV